MSSTPIARADGAVLAKASLAAGILAVAGFIGLGFTAGGWWFLVGVALGLVAVVAGVTARRQVDYADRRIALVGMILGGLIVLWFVGFMVISGIAALF